MGSIKTIGVLTSGGDAPGMNAAVRAITRTALSRGLKVMGIRRGYRGLFDGDVFEMDVRTVSNILQLGGTFLYSARFPEFKEPENIKKVVDNCHALGIDGIVAIGGDGTFRGARDLTLAGIPCVGIPGTIDNDIGCSDYAIGYDTALNTCIQMVDRLRDTSQSHDRCSVVEIMGHKAGHLALESGIAFGATAILVPELPVDIEKNVIARIEKYKNTGKRHFIIAVAEGVQGTNVHELAKLIEDRTGVESRATVLGHVQRGGSPSAKDRLVASRMGAYAVEILTQGISSCVVVIDKDKVIHRPIVEALKMTKPLNMELYNMAMEISI